MHTTHTVYLSEEGDHKYPIIWVSAQVDMMFVEIGLGLSI